MLWLIEGHTMFKMCLAYPEVLGVRVFGGIAMQAMTIIHIIYNILISRLLRCP